MSRGGARNYPKGTGRRVHLVCRVDPETMKSIDEIAEARGISRGQTIDEAIRLLKDEKSGI